MPTLHTGCAIVSFPDGLGTRLVVQSLTIPIKVDPQDCIFTEPLELSLRKQLPHLPTVDGTTRADSVSLSRDMLSEAAERDKPPDQSDSNLETRRLESTATSVGNISSKSTVTRTRRQPCKYFISKQSCPYGDNCRYLHQYPGATEDGHQICQHFIGRGGCKYGERCKFYHPKPEQLATDSPHVTGQPYHSSKTSSDRARQEHSASANRQQEQTLSEGVVGSSWQHDGEGTSLLNVTSFPSLRQQQKESGRKHHPVPPKPNVPVTAPPHPPKPKQRHTPSELSLEAFFQRATVVQTRPPVPRPQPKKAGSTADLRQIELDQLEARFPGNQSQVVEKGRERSVYRITFSPTDPKWGFQFKTVDLLVTFPSDYPTQPLAVELTNDQGLPPAYISHGNQAIVAYISTETAGQLMFRPFLRWLDKNITDVFKEAATETVKAELQSEPPPTRAADTNSEDSHSSDEVQFSDSDDLSETDSDAASDDATVHTSVAALPVKRGTEIRLQGLQMREGVGTVKCEVVKVVVQCTRCRAQHDVLLKGESPVSNACTRCYSTYTLTYHPSLLHSSSSTIGFMDIFGCIPLDLVLLACELVVTCLDCGREHRTMGLHYGQPKDMWCHKCHSQLTIAAEQCKFINHQPAVVRTPEDVSAPKKPSKSRRRRDPLIQQGKPLPEFGTCIHYKKSHRWLRFPCCGKAYPCDTCHDSTEDHPMELANRMICGFCAKEQPYTGSRPCILCGSDLAHLKSSTYWEGGQGCRNRTKMSRNDPHKYANTGHKTSSKKCERVGKHGKEKRSE